MTTAPLPDAAPANWVDRHAPAGLRPWLKLGRFDRPAGVWLLMLPGWQGIALAGAMGGGLPNARLLVLFAAGSALMRAAGCAFNDIVDRDIDAKVARTAARPVASGQISVKAAFGFIGVCCLLSLAILLTFNLTTMILGVASLALVAIYPFMKRITWWPQAWLGLTFNWGALMGYVAAQSMPSTIDFLFPSKLDLFGGTVVHFAPGYQFLGPLLFWGLNNDIIYMLPALLLYAGGVAWTLGYDTIYAVQDLEDDALAGVKSSARRLGNAAPRGVLVFYLAAITLPAVAGLSARLGPLFFAGLALYAGHLIVQARRLRIDDPRGALVLFKSNRDAGLILFAALIAGLWRGGVGT
jgi:4-hydroxybenzoate polyprenyltransferase